VHLFHRKMISMARNREQDTQRPAERRNRIAAVGDDARLLAERAFARAGFSDHTLVLHWPEIVGPEVARLSRPLKLSESASGCVLTLKAEPAASVFLQHETRSLCARINDFLGRPAVHRLRFVYGSLQADRTEPVQLRSPSVTAPSRDAARLFEGPQGLKDALVALAGTRAAGHRD
jgi:hypothetical protein